MTFKPKWKLMDWLDRFFYLKLCWTSAYSHLAIFIKVVAFAVGWGTFIKVWGLTQLWHYVVSVELGMLGVFLLFWFGDWSINNDWRDRENSLHNKYNPELMKILSESLKSNNGKIK